MDYNSKVAQSQKMEEANFARIQGTIARREAKIAQLGLYAKAGESLMAMSGGGGGGGSQGQFGSTANNSSFSNYS